MKNKYVITKPLVIERANAPSPTLNSAIGY